MPLTADCASASEPISTKPKPLDRPVSRSITLAYNVNGKEEVHATVEQARKAGAKILKEPQDVFWGGYHSYVADPDGHLWEIAFNPFTLIDDKGRFLMEACK